ncbi:MAG: Rpn family recombination-promoting nuclease/putative transposase [Candidatus Riflebacteria bacterium]|nr:Rpn family recombination-promoting nuclease/putative transposase [Candidatus Riflebacteria bacterium]
MQETPVKYLSPFTDFGFKKLFGEEYNKDLRCENERGESFIVEIQKTKQKFFKDRALYYTSFPISKQAKSGKDWNFELKAIYTVAILDFVFDEDKADPDKYRYDIKLSDIETHRVFYNKLSFIYLEMPKFNKTLEQLKTRFDKWLYVIKNLDRLHNVPEKFKDRIFKKLFAAAEIARFTPEEAESYEDSLKVYRDIENSIDTAREEGKVKGKIEGKIEAAKNMLADNLSVDAICRYTGLSSTEVEAIARKQNNKVSEPAAEYSAKKRRRRA